MGARAHQRARAAVRRRQLRRPHYPLSSPSRALQAAVAEAPTSHIDSWKGLFAALTTWIRPRPAVTQIVVAPMSDEWMRQHEATTPKHTEQI